MIIVFQDLFSVSVVGPQMSGFSLFVMLNDFLKGQNVSLKGSYDLISSRSLFSSPLLCCYLIIYHCPLIVFTDYSSNEESELTRWKSIRHVSVQCEPKVCPPPTLSAHRRGRQGGREGEAGVSSYHTAMSRSDWRLLPPPSFKQISSWSGQWILIRPSPASWLRSRRSPVGSLRDQWLCQNFILMIFAMLLTC